MTKNNRCANICANPNCCLVQCLSLRNHNVHPKQRWRPDKWCSAVAASDLTLLKPNILSMWLHPPVMVCCASMACVCVSVDSEDTVLAVQTHPVKANGPWHQAGPPLMNHAPQVNSIWTGALAGHSVSVEKIKNKQQLPENGAKIPESEFMTTWIMYECMNHEPDGSWTVENKIDQ